MIRKLLSILALGFMPVSVFAQGTLTMPAPAELQPAETAAFLDFKTAEALDDRCRFFKHFERVRVWPLEEKRLEPLSFAAFLKSGKISPEEYDAHYDALVSEARERADGIACTDAVAASPLIMPLRHEIAPQIYGDLMVAMQFGELSADQQNAARAFEAMIYPMYGEANWPAFVQSAHGKAQEIIDAAWAADNSYDPLFGTDLGGLGGTGGYLGDLYEDQAVTYARDQLIDNAVAVVDLIFFEMVAEQFGYRRFEVLAGETYAYRDRISDMSLQPVMDIWENPQLFETLDTGAKLYAVFTVDDDDNVRVMTYGENASAVSAGTVTLMVEEAPTGEVSSFDMVRSAEWWSTARRFEGELVDETCLGGPCFALPPAIIDTIAAAAPGNAFRIFFTGGTTTSDPNPDDPLLRSGYGYKVDYREEMIALGL